MTQTGMTPRVAALLRKAGAGEILDADAVARNPRPDKGPYLLVICLERRLPVAWRSSEHVFEPGWYIYAGSARGPGGIAARLRRHFRREKKIHWHVDHLTTSGRVVAACAFPGGNECEPVGRLVRSPSVTSGPKGFGSSDCRGCRSHLVCVR
jgi:Uri superfamily endonuclease